MVIIMIVGISIDRKRVEWERGVDNRRGKGRERREEKRVIVFGVDDDERKQNMTWLSGGGGDGPRV